MKERLIAAKIKDGEGWGYYDKRLSWRWTSSVCSGVTGIYPCNKITEL